MTEHEGGEQEAGYPPGGFQRDDQGDDRWFYTQPRLVVHIDEPAIEAIGRYFAEALPSQSQILDLMSSWRTHLPQGFVADRVVGLGMNAVEMMEWATKAVIFDLFGTLVRDFLRQEHDRVNAQMADALGIPYPELWQLMGETGQDRYSGRYRSIEDNIQDICFRSGVEAGAAQIQKAAGYRYEFTANVLVPEERVLEALRTLKDRGLGLGLISNCGPDVPLLWERSPLAQLIDVPVFSCEEHVTKPDSAIYRIACDRLQVDPKECVFVGDGSSQELTGAAATGMLPILKRTDLSDVYDSHRPEVENWQGRAVEEIRELVDVLGELAAITEQD